MLWIILIIVIVAVTGGILFLSRPTPDLYQQLFSFYGSGRYNEMLELGIPRLGEEALDSRVPYYLALACLKLEQPARARELFWQVIERGEFSMEVDELEVRKNYALLSYMQKDINEAFHEFRLLYDLYPEDALTNACLGFIYIGKERFAESLPYLEKATKYEANRNNRVATAVALFYNDQDKEALKLINGLVNDHGDDTQVLLLAAVLEMFNNNFENALVLFNRLEAGLGDDLYVRYLVYRSMVYLAARLQNREELDRRARPAADLAARIGEDDETVAINYLAGLGYMRMNEAGEAHGFLVEAESINPGYQSIFEVAAFRSDLEDRLLRVNQKTKDGFSFIDHFEDYMAAFLNREMVYAVSGLQLPQEVLFDERKGPGFKNRARKPKKHPVSVEEYMQADKDAFELLCTRLASYLGYRADEFIIAPEGGFDCIAGGENDKAYFQFRQWDSENIGDSVVRGLAEKVKAAGADWGYLVLPSAASEAAAEFAKKSGKIRLVNEDYLADLLSKL